LYRPLVIMIKAFFTLIHEKYNYLNSLKTNKSKGHSLIWLHDAIRKATQHYDIQYYDTQHKNNKN